MGTWLNEQRGLQAKGREEMKPYYEDSAVTQYCDHALNVLSQLEPEIAQACVTSPPYWGLRKYAGEQDIVWGDNHCEHEWGNEFLGDTRGYGAGLDNWQHKTSESVLPHYKASQGQFCQSCGAWRGAYGLEPSPELYVAHSIEILRAIRRVLRKDGVVFWNIGDSYTRSGVHSGGSDKQRSNTGAVNDYIQSKRGDILKPKDLCLIPFRVAIAAQEDGWWVRSVIIWSKSNPMPESVRDRPTESHEYILMLTKSKDYYWDIEAVREPLTYPDRLYNPDTSLHKTIELTENGNRTTSGLHDRRTQYSNPAGRNLRSVWEVNTQPYPEAHFATFPEKIPERCILAATSEKGNCSKCGKPWVRIVEKGFTDHTGTTNSKSDPKDKLNGPTGRLALLRQAAREQGHEYINESKTLGWKPTCNCEAPSEPPVVLDPFSGSGTTLWVAKRLGRRAIGIDTSSEYCDLAIERNRQQAMPL